jgi:hypothetical protein
MFVVTGSPTQAFVDAVKDRLDGDTTLAALVTGTYGHLSEAARVAYPYLVLGQRTLDNEGGAMGLPGGRITLQLDGWSDRKGPSQMHTILSRVRVLLERQTLRLDGFVMVVGSLTCELEDVFDEPDEDKPGNRLYHGVQRWVASVDAAP